MFHVLPAQVPSLLATWHTNILCIVFTKEEEKKVLQENKTKRQATRACVRIGWDMGARMWVRAYS